MFQPSGSRQRLGVNVDHVATIRNARGGMHPDPVRAALTAIDAGADSITVHLREDRRHISDIDIAQLRQKLKHPLNLEMAATDEMLSIALSHRPAACCLVPERRDERTTEGGGDVASDLTYFGRYIYDLQSAGCRVSLFVDPDIEQIDAARKVAADVVELHTGRYCEAALANNAVAVEMELERIRAAAEHAHNRDLKVHAGHGLTYATVPEIAKIDPIIELNIGHFLIGEAIFCGLHSAVERMRSVMDYARGEVKLKDTA